MRPRSIFKQQTRPAGQAGLANVIFDNGDWVERHLQEPVDR